MIRGLLVALSAAVVFGGLAAFSVNDASAYRPTVGTSGAAIPALYKNCTALNKKYPHGLGRAGARDKTSGVPVTTFRRSTTLYQRAMSYNKGLDRDKDGIACEKR